MSATRTDSEPLKAPFPYFGGKSSIAHEVWARFGDVRNYVEPFFGSGAVLLNRPLPFAGTETVNDKDGLVCNFWRAVRTEPDAVAFHADNPVNENDLHARHSWLVGVKDSMQTRLDADPEYFDAKIAGWWCWGMCCWIGSGFCSGNGPWHVVEDAEGVRQLVHLGNAGQGINRQLVHLGDAGRGTEDSGPVRASTASESEGVNRKMPHMNNHGSPARGIAGAAEGVTRQMPFFGGGKGQLGRGVTSGPAVTRSEGVYDWMQRLSDRMRLVRVCSGDWSRVCGPTVTVKQGLTAVFLDPPYADTAGRQSDLYRVDCESVAHAVREWATAQGDDPRMRIALCGYEGEHKMPDSWECLAWKARGGYGSQGNEESDGKANAKKERIWFSPHCVKQDGERQKSLFGDVQEAK